MERLQLKADIREVKGKTLVKGLRNEGLIPAVVYGLDKEPVKVSINAREANRVIKENAVVELLIADNTEVVVVKEVQRDPVKKDILHVDFKRSN